MLQYGYFSEINITLPTEVRNAIEDVFLENDEIDGVECYHKEDLEQFQKDLTLLNDVRMTIDGTNSGLTNNVWTYYGNITYSLSENICLYDADGVLIEEISKLENEKETVVEKPNDYVITLLERVEWDSSESLIHREPKLYIYCPVVYEEDEPDKYENLYNELKSEVEYGTEL